MRSTPRPFIQHQKEYTARIDQTLGTKDNFWFRYSAIYYDTSGSGGLPGVTNTITDNPGQNFGASWVHTFSPTLILQAQYGRSHQETNSSTVYPNLSASTIQGLGFDPNFAGNFIGGFSLLPAIGISGYTRYSRYQQLAESERNQCSPMEGQRLEDHRQSHVPFRRRIQQQYF